MLNSGQDRPLRGHDRKRDGQSRQSAPKGHHRDDAGDHPERGDDPERGGDRVVAGMVPSDRDVPHVCLAASRRHRLIRRRLVKRLSDGMAAQSWVMVTHFTGRITNGNFREVQPASVSPYAPPMREIETIDSELRRMRCWRNAAS